MRGHGRAYVTYPHCTVQAGVGLTMTGVLAASSAHGCHGAFSQPVTRVVFQPEGPQHLSSICIGFPALFIYFLFF